MSPERVFSVPSSFGPPPAATAVVNAAWNRPVSAPVSVNVTSSLSPVMSLTTETCTESTPPGLTFGSASLTCRSSVSPGAMLGVMTSAAASPPTTTPWSVRSSEALVGSLINSSR